MIELIIISIIGFLPVVLSNFLKGDYKNDKIFKNSFFVLYELSLFIFYLIVLLFIIGSLNDFKEKAIWNILSFNSDNFNFIFLLILTLSLLFLSYLLIEKKRLEEEDSNKSNEKKNNKTTNWLLNFTEKRGFNLLLRFVCYSLIIVILINLIFMYNNPNLFLNFSEFKLTDTNPFTNLIYRFFIIIGSFHVIIAAILLKNPKVDKGNININLLSGKKIKNAKLIQTYDDSYEILEKNNNVRKIFNHSIESIESIEYKKMNDK